jgi:hypothetical protein
MSDYGGTFTIQIFASQPMADSTVAVAYGGYSGFEEMGTSPNNDLNHPGTTVFADGSALGTGYDVQLLAAPGAGDALSTLVPTGPVISTWWTAAGGDPGSLTGSGPLNGFWLSGAIVTINGAAADTSATVALSAWDNEGGTVTSLSAAQAANDPWGVSDTGGGACHP